MPDACAVYGQHVKEELAQELGAGVRYDLFPRWVFWIAIGEEHMEVGCFVHAGVGDAHPMGITAQVVQHLLRSGERALRVDCQRTAKTSQ